MAGNAWGQSWGITGKFAWGGSWGEEAAVVVTPPTQPTIPPGGGLYDHGHRGSEYWRRYQAQLERQPQKKKKVDELEEAIAELRSRIVEAPQEEDTEAAERALRVGMALARNPLDASMVEIGRAIAKLNAAAAEIDDEEAVLLLT